MDGGSSLAPGLIWKCDVFLSFSEDTANNFTDHLLAALKRKGISTFIGDKKSGDVLSPKILKAIEECQISIFVFSRNYAASTCCLDELASIMANRDFVEQTVLPVFYDVKPYEVRKQGGVYRKAFAEHEERFRDNLEKTWRWRESMTAVANMSGWILGNQLEAEVIDSIVKRAINILSHKCLSFADDLVGIQSRVEALVNLLNISSDAVRVVGICGMRGIGKTTLATVLYHKIFDQFDACCFLQNVSEFSKSDGLIALQERLLRATLKWKELDICNVYEGSVWIRRTLEYSKTLLVLDNVDELEQLETLARYPHWFGAGSRIIITTRDEHIFNRFEVDEIYKVELLNNDDALQLFSRSAFKYDHPVEGYAELTLAVLEYAKNLPLAIKSLGSFLLDRSVSEWKSALAKLQLIPDHSIMKLLRQSFDGLPDDIEKGILLDIERFLVGEKIDYVKEIPSHHQFYPMLGNRIFIDKSLMTLSDLKIHMNDMLGEILRQETHKEQGRTSGLWFYDDFRHVMEKNTVTTNIEAVVLNQEVPEGVELNAKVFKKLINLRLLMIRNVNFLGSLEYLSDELVYFSWHKYPFTYLPPNFEPHGLVELIMPESSITQLWEGIKMLPKLRCMSFSGSKNLIKTPDLSGVLNLEMLDLEGCSGLLQVHPSIAILPKLTFLNLKNCTSLVSIPNNLSALSSLETLNLDGCSILVKIFGNRHCPFFTKILCYHFILYLKGIKNYKLVFCGLICLIFSIFVGRMLGIRG